MAVQHRPRVGLVLGAGGVLGGAWTAGALVAIARNTGWDPSKASHIVGTSAGSVFAALTAASVSADRLLPGGQTAAETVDDLNDWLLGELAARDSYAPHGMPVPLPGSIRLTVSGIRGGNGLGMLKSLCGLAPAGLVSTDPIRRTIVRAVGGDSKWVAHPNCWVVACDYSTGARTVFGRSDAPSAAIADAVAASCAIPGYFEPVRIDGRLFVDGGIHSMSNADLLVEENLDLVICVSPMSARVSAGSWHPLDRVAAAMRKLSAWQLEREVAALLDAGTHVLVLEPSARDIECIGSNVMDASRSLAVAETAIATVASQLERPDVRELMRVLPRRRATVEEARKKAAVVAGFLRRAAIPAAAAMGS